MSNRHLVKPLTDIILARLKVLFESLNDTYQTGKMVLENDIISNYHESIDLFYNSLDKSITGTISDIYAGAPADPTKYNRLMTAVQKDIESVFGEVAVLDRLVSSSFNSIISEREQILETTKNISNKLNDYLLYADPSLGAGYFFGDSFNVADKLEIGSSLVEADECMVDTNEGIVLLPLDGVPERPDVKSLIINKPSNGTKGSNYQLDVFGHDTIEVISDGEPDTWFEYEKVTASESNVPLIFDLTIVLKEVSVINHININPINFGTPSPVSITTIETSKDGIEYASIKDEIPVVDFIPEEEDNVFELSSVASKNAGQGFYSFLPRKVQYVHIVFEQNTAYSIQTNSGIRLRYAIGLRDINILQRKFKTTGSLVSAQFSIDGDARKISLWASENPKQKSILSDISHFLSHDDGGTWFPLQPQARTSFGVPEIINFNNISDDAIITNEQIDTFRHKISMTRDTKAFSGDAILKHEKLQYLDIVNVPSGGAPNITLTNNPIEETVRVLLPYFGSFSCPRARYGSVVADESPPMDLDFVEFNVDVPASQTIPIVGGGSKLEGTIRYNIPFRNIPNLEHKLRVFHNGAQIEYLPKDEDIFADSPTSYTAIDAYSKVYFLNKKGTELQFGHKDSTGTQRGFIPAAGSRIEVCLDGDNPPISVTDRGYILNLTVPSDGQKESVSIVALKNLSNSEAIPFEIEIPSGTAEFKPPISDTMPAIPKLSSGASQMFDPITMGLGHTSKHKISDGEETIINKNKDSRIKTLSVKYEYSPNTKGIVKKKQIDLSLNKKLQYQSQEASNKAAVSIYNNNAKDKQESEDISTTVGSDFAEGQDGMYPPIFLEGTANFQIKEFDRTDGSLVTSSQQFTGKVAFKDGDSELRDSTTHLKVASRYTFDPYSGTVYLGSKPYANRRVVLIAQKIELIIIPPELWKYDRHIVTNRVNTQKIVLDPSVVYTIKQKTEFSYAGDATNSINLLTGNEKSHDWFNKRIIKGSVIPGNSLFPVNAKPVEVLFVDGKSELANIVKVEKEPITFALAGDNLYSFTLQQLTSTLSDHSLVGAPTFGAVRSELSTSTPTSIFDIDGQLAAGSTPTVAGEWVVDEVLNDTVITVYSATAPDTHVVSYHYQNNDPGIDAQGLYSVDYKNGTIYFSNDIPASGEVKYEVSAYSAFYNIAKVVSDADIKEINEEERNVVFSSSFGMQFIKQNTASKLRPQVLKVVYDYYKTSTESLADLEPYFSPICKDVAFKAVTSKTLEEL